MLRVWLLPQFDFFDSRAPRLTQKPLPSEFKVSTASTKGSRARNCQNSESPCVMMKMSSAMDLTAELRGLLNVRRIPEKEVRHD